MTRCARASTTALTPRPTACPRSAACAATNSLLAKLTDLVETNDIAGFVDIYQQVCDLYSGISDKLPDSMKELYEMLVRITELENMKDLVICLNKLSTATRGFGLYTITSENGKLTLDTLTRDGFGDPFNHGLRAFAANDEQGWMVIGTANPFMGTQLWRTTVDMTDPMDRFTDLDPNGWAYPSIEYCVRHGLMSGMSDTIFSPNTVTTRAQLVQVLYNFEGKPDVSDVAVPFTDAASGWYRDAVAWAYKTGVVDGMSPTTFAPNNTVTREQVAVILMRYLTKVCGVERTWTPDDLSGFADGGNVSGWARRHGRRGGARPVRRHAGQQRSGVAAAWRGHDARRDRGAPAAHVHKSARHRLSGAQHFNGRPRRGRPLETVGKPGRFSDKGLQSAARRICAPQAHKFHTCSLSSIFSHAHVARENDCTFLPPAGGKLCEAFLTR